VKRQGDEPKDFWSQSMCWGDADVSKLKATKLLVRFRNDGGRAFARCETHIAYAAGKDPAKVTFAWTDDRGNHQASHARYPVAGADRAKRPHPVGRDCSELMDFSSA